MSSVSSILMTVQFLFSNRLTNCVFPIASKNSKKVIG